MGRRLRLASLLLLILLATGLAGIGANSPSNFDIDGDMSEAKLAEIRAGVIREGESSRAVFRRTGGIFRDETTPNIVYVYMAEPDVGEAENVYQELWGGGRARVIPVQRDYSAYQLRAWERMASKGLDDAVGVGGTSVGLHLRENRIEVYVRCWHMTDDAIRVLRGLGIPEGAVEFEVNLEGRCPGEVSIEYVDLLGILGFPLLAALAFFGGAVLPAKLRDDLDPETWRPWSGVLW